MIFYLQRPLQLHSAQAVAARNSREEESSSISETFFQSDQTTMQQHILDDVVTLCSGNSKNKGKKTNN